MESYSTVNAQPLAADKAKSAFMASFKNVLDEIDARIKSDENETMAVRVALADQAQQIASLAARVKILEEHRTGKKQPSPASENPSGRSTDVPRLVDGLLIDAVPPGTILPGGRDANPGVRIPAGTILPAILGDALPSATSTGSIAGLLDYIAKHPIVCLDSTETKERYSYAEILAIFCRDYQKSVIDIVLAPGCRKIVHDFPETFTELEHLWNPPSDEEDHIVICRRRILAIIGKFRAKICRIAYSDYARRCREVLILLEDIAGTANWNDTRKKVTGTPVMLVEKTIPLVTDALRAELQIPVHMVTDEDGVLAAMIQQLIYMQKTGSYNFM